MAPLNVWRAAVVAVAAGVIAACGPRPPIARTARPGGPVRVMGAARLNADQLVAWFNYRQAAAPGPFAATEPVDKLARYFLEEGADEGVAGDVAFMQSLIETAWFRFGGLVDPGANNFAGIGATNSNPAPAAFSSARLGIRAQIQHLRAYADARAVTCTRPPLRHACVDPRFDLVKPKGKAPTWNQMGNGNWASTPAYAGSILALYDNARAFVLARTPLSVGPPRSAAAPPRSQKKSRRN
jgi:hypothetical protein